jgi:hypothetical protein
MQTLNFLKPMHVRSMYLSSYSTLRPSHGQVVCVNARTVNIRTRGITMGPLTAAVVLYSVDRLVTRVMARQIHRKGVLRKIRRLISMVTEFHMICELVQDVVEDIWTQ